MRLFLPGLFLFSIIKTKVFLCKLFLVFDSPASVVSILLVADSSRAFSLSLSNKACLGMIQLRPTFTPGKSPQIKRDATVSGSQLKSSAKSAT